MKKCDCGGKLSYSRYCAVDCCEDCGYHDGLARCYCGWSLSGGDGYNELLELGETIEPEE